MATAIIGSRDCLRDQFHPRNPKFNRNRRRNRRSNHDSSSSPSAKGLVMGQVKILKRGEESKARMLFAGENVDLGLQLCSTDRLGPDPIVLQKQIRVPDLYAGSTMVSPPPSSVPFPTTLLHRFS